MAPSVDSTNPFEKNVRNILQSIPESELLSCRSAFDLALNLLLGCRYSYDVVAEIPDLCRPQDVNMILVILPDAALLLADQGSDSMKAEESGNIIAAIHRILKRHPKYADFISDSASLSSERIEELILGYMNLTSNTERYFHIGTNAPQIFSSGVDVRLAMAAEAAYLDEEYGIEHNYMQFRKALVLAKETGEFS